MITAPFLDISIVIVKPAKSRQRPIKLCDEY
jgi:hypothetical protein